MPSSTYMYDVAVGGGGAAGTAAAVGAAQAGARTALFESFGCLGGAATMKSVTTYCGLYTEHSRQVVFGVAEQLRTDCGPSEGSWNGCVSVVSQPFTIPRRSNAAST
jgi:succinate dehydrogenase/fumarate reductase flavoprotein subunit